MTPRRVRLVSGDRCWDVAVLDGGLIELDGRSFEIGRGPSGAVLVNEGNGHVLAHATADGPRIWVHLGGEVHVFEVETPGAGRVGPRADEAMLAAPMPATVREVRVSVGDAIARGDVLVMLEAMKMELPLRAPHDGVVRAVHCITGQLVQPGVPLVELA